MDQNTCNTPHWHLLKAHQRRLDTLDGGHAVGYYTALRTDNLPLRTVTQMGLMGLVNNAEQRKPDTSSCMISFLSSSGTGKSGAQH